MYGLVIKKKWLDKILSGEKILEIRGSKTTHTGEVIALLESGSSVIKGFCKIQEVIPLNEKNWEKEKPNHCVNISFSKLKERYKTPYAWHLCGVVSCKTALTYKHPNGAVIWVNLDNVVIYSETGERVNMDTIKGLYQILRNTRKYHSI